MKAIQWIGGMLICWLCLSHQVIGQIENVVISQEGRNIIINYDLYSSRADEIFSVTLRIQYLEPEKGMRTIRPVLVSGDLEDVIPGSQKQILWQAGEELGSLEVPIKVILETRSSFRGKSPVVNLLKSAVLPGWGISEKGKPNWIAGVIGYAAIGGAYFFNQEAQTDYDTYLTSTNSAVRDELFSQAQNKDDLSNGLGIGAMAIWGLSLGWTAIKSFSPKENEGKLELVFMDKGVTLVLKF